MPFRYGDGTLYGSGATYGAYLSTTRAVTFGFRVDWDNDGVLDGTNEVAYLDSSNTLQGRLLSWNIRVGRQFVFKSSSDGFEHVAPGTLEVELLDTDGRYDPYNTSSPLSGSLYKNQLVKFSVLSESTGTLYSAFTGYISNIKNVYGGAVQKAIIYVDGALTTLESESFSSIMVQDNTVDTIIGIALDSADYPLSSDLDSTVVDNVENHFFTQKSWGNSIHDLADSAFGVFYTDEDGTATYKSRVKTDISTQSITEDDIDYDYGVIAPAVREVIKNSIKAYYYPQETGSSVLVWTLSETFPLNIGDSVSFWVKFESNGRQVGASSAPAFSGLITQNEDGSGSSSSSITDEFVIGTGSGFFVNYGYLTLTNTSAINGYLTSGTLTFTTGYYEPSGRKLFTLSEDDTSISEYGRRELILDLPYAQNNNLAQEISDAILEKFKNPHIYPRFKFKRSDIDKQFTTPLFNLITVNFASKGITGEFRAGYIERSWSINDLNVIDSVYYLEPNLSVAAASAWTFPMTFPTIFT